MLPTGLFIDSPEMSDVSMTQLTNDTESWPEEIITKLKERVPEAGGMNTIVKFMKEDEETGTATGSIIMTNGKKSAVVPVIIKDFSMYPLDVIISENRTLPLTPDFFAAIFGEQANPFNNLEEYPFNNSVGRFEEGNLWNVTYPPSLGRYAYASANYPMTEEIASTIDGKMLKEALLKDTQSALRYSKNGHGEYIKKVANLQPVNMNEFRQGADNLIDRNIMMLRKEGPHKYSILASADKTFAPMLLSNLSSSDCKPFMARISGSVEDTMNEVDQNGEKILTIDMPEDNGRVYIEKGVDHVIERANEFGHFVVKKKNGVEVEGMVIPKVIDLNMNLQPMKVFIGRTLSTIQSEIAGVRVENSSFKVSDTLFPQVGQTGTFMLKRENNAICTVPFTVESVSERGGPEFYFKVSDLMGRRYKLKWSHHMELERIAFNQAENCFLIPAQMKWVPMEGFQEVSSTVADYAVKLAGENRTAAPVRLIKTSADSYCMKGVNKYASAAGWDASNLQPHEARFMLASLGASAEKVAMIMKTASVQDEVVIHGLNAPLTKQEKIARAIPMAEKMQKVANSLRANLIKEASYVENSQTVDALLALNFVNPENITKFVGKIPLLKSAVSTLTSLLIASRIGIKEIPEQPTISAIQRLVEVINGLETLRSTQEGA